MTAKEKAQELVESFKHLVRFDKIYEEPIIDLQIDCAIIAVDEILKASTIKLSDRNNGKFIYIDNYWNEVKTELQNLK